VNRRTSIVVVALLLIGAAQSSSAGLVPAGGATDVCASAKQDAFGDGYGLGVQQCQQDPTAFGITLSQVLETGGYGETEPNDNMISANVLVAAVPFTGQSYGPSDRDLFYLVTSKPNEILTIDFTVPGRDPATQDVSGWVIQVTDSSGNVYAKFSTDYNQGNPNGDDEITYPVTLGLAGTYYVVVSPVPFQNSAGQMTVTNDYYSLAVVLRDSDINSLPVAVNFFDTEVEPNNTYTDANPIATGVTMYGMINLSFAHIVQVVGEDTAQYAQGDDPDWYVFQTDGNEIINLSFCNKEACGDGDWFVEVFDAAGAAQAESGEATPLVAFNTASASGWPYNVTFGVKQPGPYYMRVNLKRKLTAPCLETQPTQECLNSDGICIVQQCEGEGDTQSCADVVVDNCGLGNTAYVEKCYKQFDQCVEYGKTVVLPENEVTAQYNFTWYGTQMQPFTADSDAYKAYMERASSVPTGN
jgi:hypothetical protein